MGYKILGFAVWRGGKWYLHRRYPDIGRKATVAGVAGLLLAALVIGGAVAAQRGTDDA